MSTAHDARFTDMFTVVVGILIGIAITLGFLATAMGGSTQEAQLRADAGYQLQVAERITPVGAIAVAGEDNSALQPLGVATAPPLASNAVLSGEEVYGMACMVCHGSGVAGAPRFGDRTVWAPRLAKGIEALHQSALRGTQSAAGVMPAKGGRADLSDASIVNGVDYMVNAAR